DAAKALTKKNQQFLKSLAKDARAGQAAIGGTGFDVPALKRALGNWLHVRVILEESDEQRTSSAAHRLREEKEQRFRAAYLAPDSPAHRLKEVADLWCAAWFWPEEEDVAAFTSAEFADAAARILDG